MRGHGLAVAVPRRWPPRTTNSEQDQPVVPNLLKPKFAADRPDAVRRAAIRSLPAGEGWL
jgi:hypothetical protein